MTDTTTKTLPCVLIPMTDRQLLLPNVSIAEVVDHNTDLEGHDGPSWLAGFLEWRGLQLPVISYEGANGQSAVMPGTGRGRVVVLNTIGPSHDRLPFLAIITQGIPSQARLEPEQVQGTEDTSKGPADLMQVDLEGEPVWIPDLEYLENLGLQALDRG
ncbi:chemosensory pili system protein ChpC [Marinobacter daqiaonensis]|uniref:Chemosensory pili system protein ChpC n=1 Tax=Marinobacter daqiaonensis TaxID=650891 RepID=A0A1I6I8W4_9GAMM|nr:chemotaxis protein CheW [Marinobacter daqiaonensis]SFR63156.1 chemosensory pili system protein ChpC [Marinobacter daqiaonensis]